MSGEREEKLRIDKWLWAARFYKTRSVAADAISSGKVTLNGARVKPAHVIRLGDALAIRTPGAEYTVRVSGLSAHRGSASDAARLYSETEESRRQRELARLTHSQRQPDSFARGRPTKRARRHLGRFRGEPI